ncbi:hypothetical protein [Methylobrevis pamukkalensis]|nr:hypothetical protein [Methylobrevis pamukkalensis]
MAAIADGDAGKHHRRRGGRRPGIFLDFPAALADEGSVLLKRCLSMARFVALTWVMRTGTMSRAMTPVTTKTTKTT